MKTFHEMLVAYREAHAGAVEADNAIDDAMARGFVRAELSEMIAARHDFIVYRDQLEVELTKNFGQKG